MKWLARVTENGAWLVVGCNDKRRSSDESTGSRSTSSRLDTRKSYFKEGHPPKADVLSSRGQETN